MKLWTTDIQAIDPHSRELVSFMGPLVPGKDRIDAQNYCDRNGLGYCRVIDEFVGEVDMSGTEIVNEYHYVISMN